MRKIFTRRKDKQKRESATISSSAKRLREGEMVMRDQDDPKWEKFFKKKKKRMIMTRVGNRGKDITNGSLRSKRRKKMIVSSEEKGKNSCNC